MGEAAVYLVPVTFGFGPAALATAVARQLRVRHPDITVIGVGDGIALDFLRGSGLFDDNALQEAPPGALPDSMGCGAPAVAVFFADFDRLAAARGREVRTVVVDPLYWMRNEDEAEPARVDRYFALAFPGVAERAGRRGVNGRTVQVIPQIVDLVPVMPEGERAGTILNLGGGVAPTGNNHAYLRALVEIVASTLGAAEQLLVTCSSAAVKAIGLGGRIPGVTAAELPPGQMMAALGACAQLLTLPGQSIMWEALRMRAPTVVLPGANYSQHLQLAAYRRYFTGIPFLTWDDLDGYRTLPPGLPEEEGIALAGELGTRLATDRRARQQLEELLAAAISARPPDGPALRDGHPWSDFDGALHVADGVMALARQTG